METTPTPPRYVVRNVLLTILILTSFVFSILHAQPVISLGRAVNEKASDHQNRLLPDCGGGPCDATRWTGGAAWIGACPNSACDIDDGPSANGGIVRCGNSAETQSNIHPNSCYDPNVFTASIGGTCTDPNTGLPVSLTLPLVDQQVLWFNFDVRAFAGGYDFQVIGGNEDVAWILYYSTTPQCCLGGFSPGISGNCNSLTYYACGTSFNNWAAQPFTTPIFDMTTNVYLLVWDQGFSKGNTNNEDFSINFKARYGCGENCSFLTNGAPVITCQSNGSYTVFQNVVGTSTTVTVVAPGSTSIVTNPSPLTFTDLDPGPPPNVNAGTVTVTYPSGVNYNITMTPSGTGVTCNPITLSGTAPVCCVPPTCTIDGPTSVCPNSTNVHCGPVGAGGYSWSITGAGTINGTNTNSCVTVTASSACNSTYTLTLEAGAPGCTSTCMYVVTVSDVSAPMISCPPNLTIQCTASTAPGGANGTATATDNCSAPGAVTITSSDVTAAGACPQAYSITRTWRATDACGNSSTCNQLISIIDNTAPNITCPADLTFQCASQVPPPNTSMVSATDLCGTATVSFVADVTTNQTCINRYTLTRTYRATDACGNSTTCNQIITVNDQSPPTIICPANVTVSCIGQVPPVNTATVMTMDNCGSNVTVTFVGDAITGTTCTNRLTVTRTYRATDACGNSATCNQIITVFDQTPPSITCPANTTVTCATNVPAPDITSVTKSDNCGGTPTVTFVSDVTSNQTCTNRYTVTRTYRATDACGNSATCTQTIVVNDQTPPTLTCPVSGSVSCASQVPAPNVASVTATDNCGGAPVITFVSDVTTNQTCVNRYTLTRTYRATDACGNSATCTQVIVVNDVTPPTLTCPANATFQCASQVPAPDTGSVTATDNCNGVPTITFVSDVTTNQTCGSRYTLTRTYRATDECGNSATCTQVLTVFDNSLPTITCPAGITVQCASQVPAPNTGSVTTSDNCSGTPIVAFVNDVTTNQTCLNRYNIIRTYSATDACGNTATCSQTIVVFDNTVPSITCPGNVTVQCASQVPAPNTASVTASDNCNGAPTVTFVGDVTTNQTCINRYTLTRTYRATDECGNSATCTQVITVNDQTPPSITCPPNVTFQCASQVPAPNITSVMASDNCGGAPSITFVNDVTTNQTCVNRYLVTRTYRATDACGNSATCTQTITVFDNTDPSITCPANVTVQCASQVPAPNIGAVTASDNCNGIPVITFVGDVTTNQTCTNRYILTRTYRATDECGNSATCTQTITVFDNTIPTLTCPSNVTVQCASQVPAPNTGAVTASDNCGVTPPSITFVGDVTTGQTCINRYTVIRTYRATDVCGNSATCTQTILVFDNTAPSITCPANITVTCSTDVPAPNTGIISASDNCNGTLQITFVGDVTTNQICANKYTLIRTYRATDECGNSATCSYLITVSDQTPPTITCPEDVTVSCASQVPPVNLLLIVASDNCTGTITIQHVGDVTTNQTCANRYTLTRTYRAIDACGNSTSCNQVITVFDNTPPVIFCPPDITVGVQESTNPENTGFPQSTDMCSGLPQLDYSDVTTDGICALEYTIDRTWTATDACGNSATCSQVIEVSGGCFLDLSLDKSLATGQSMVFTPGDDITFSIRVTNNGNIPVGSIEVVDYIPIGFSLNDPDWTAGTDGSTGQSASIVMSIGNGYLPMGGLAPTAFVDVDIVLKSANNLTGGSYINTAEIASVFSVSGADISSKDVDSHPDVDNTNDPPGEDDIDPLEFCAQIEPVILGDHTSCTGDSSVYTVQNFNPDHNYNWQVGFGGVIVNSTDSSITVLWFAPAGSLVTIVLTETAGEACQFNTVFDVNIGDGGPLACFDNINLSITNDCGTRILSGMILTGDQHGDNSYEVFVIDPITGDTLPDDIVDWTWVGHTLIVSVRSPCSGQSCWGYVKIEDKAPPIINCFCPAGIEGERCRISCMVVDQLLNGEIPEQIKPTIVDDCGGATLTLLNVDLNYADCSQGSATITWKATDAFGNSATCEQAFDVVPLSLAELQWPPDFLGDCDESDDPDHTGWPRLDGINLSEVVAACNIWTSYTDQTIGLCGDGRKIIRRWTVINWCTSETRQWTQTILLKDKLGPVLTCAPDFTVSTSVWNCFASVNMPRPHAVDACSSVQSYQLFSSAGNVVVNGNQYTISDLPVGTHQARWIVTDECYNSSTCIIQITVKDQVPPVVTCQRHTIVSLTNDRPNGITFMPADALDDGSFDNCTNVHFRARRMTSCIDIDWTTGGACVDDIPGGIPPVNDYDLGTAWGTCVPFACCDVGAGPIMVMLEVSDDVGNVNTCMVEVEVQDKIAPDVICPPVIFLSCDYPLEVHPGTYSDAEGNNNGNLDEDPLSELFGNMFDAFRYPESARQPVIINDPANTQYHQPYNWGLDGWATDNCSVDLSVTVRVIDDCSGASFPGDHPANAVKLIERRFIANDGVQSGSCLQRIWVIDYHRFYISDTNCNNEDPNDGVIWPCDELVTTCPMEVTNTGEPVIIDDGCSLIGVTYEDTRFDFAEGACFKILREWKIIDWCQFNANTGYGLWTFTQTIKVADQEGAEFLECPSGLVELCTDDPGVSLPSNNQVFLGENNPNSSSCSVHVIQHQPVREMCSTSVIYDVKLYVLGDPDPIQLKPETVLELDANHEGDLYFNTAESDIPDIANYGLSYNDPLCDDFYRVLWTVEDGCGNRTYCDYLMRLVDCKKPVPVCLDGISTNEMPPDGQVTLWASDFNASSYDDCTPSTQLLFSFSGDFYEPSFTFTCDNVPVFGVPFDVSIWAADGGYDQNCNGEVEWSERNTDLCIASLVITDNNDVCDQNGLVLVGEVTTEQTEAVSNATINLTTNQLNFPPFLTADDGKYHFGHLIPGLDYTIKPERNDNPRNGVSTLDLVQIQRHLLGKEPFSSSYQYIAADANNSGSVSAIDMIEIRKLILGLYPEFPNNTSWRFVPKEEGEASGPPWPLTENIVLSDLQPNENKNLDFVGIKIGDVNHSAQAHATQLFPRNARPVLKVNAKGNPEVKAGDEFEVRFNFPKTVSGFQWTFETTGLEYAGIESNSIPIEDANVGLPDKGIITMSWNGEAVSNNGKQGVDFTLRLKAIESGNLSEMIRMTSRITQAEAYALDGTIMDVAMDVNSDSPLTDFALYQNKPNPWDGQTLIEFDLPYEASARMTIYDIAGKVVKEIEANYKAGHNSIMLTSHDIPTPGVLYYRLDSGPYSAVRKMMIFH